MNARYNSRNKYNCFDINKNYILELFEQQKGLCYWFKIPMIPAINIVDPQKPTIDRLNVKEGYIKNNVVLACYAANIGRSDSSIKDFREFVKLIKKENN